MKCRCGEEYDPLSNTHYDHMRIDYTINIDGVIRGFCKDCGSEVDEYGFCYCHR